MPYSPIPYTNATTVKRILRTVNNKIRIGENPGELSEGDLEAYILDASMYIDSFIRASAGFDNLPVITYAEKPEITFSAPRLAAYYIHRSMYASYRKEDLGAGVLGWLEDATDHLKMLIEHINVGVYTDLSSAKCSAQFITVEQFFQTKIGIRGIRGQKSDVENVVPTKTGNIGPYNNGSEI